MASQALREGRTQQRSVAFEKSVAVVDEAMRSVRRLVLDLGQAVVKEVGLVPAVRMYVRQFSSRSWIDVIVEAEDLPAEVPRPLQVALYRLSVQLLDFCRRGGAQNVEISFKGKRQSIAIIVEAASQRLPYGESWATLRASEFLGAILHSTSRETFTKIEFLVPLRGLGKTGAGRSIKSECHQDRQP
jgi:signal transduction histidine kinase